MAGTGDEFEDTDALPTHDDNFKALSNFSDGNLKFLRLEVDKATKESIRLMAEAKKAADEELKNANQTIKDANDGLKVANKELKNAQKILKAANAAALSKPEGRKAPDDTDTDILGMEDFDPEAYDNEDSEEIDAEEQANIEAEQVRLAEEAKQTAEKTKQDAIKKVAEIKQAADEKKIKLIAGIPARKPFKKTVDKALEIVEAKPELAQALYATLHKIQDNKYFYLSKGKGPANLRELGKLAAEQKKIFDEKYPVELNPENPVKYFAARQKRFVAQIEQVQLHLFTLQRPGDQTYLNEKQQEEQKAIEEYLEATKELISAYGKLGLDENATPNAFFTSINDNKDFEKYIAAQDKLSRLENKINRIDLISDELKDLIKKPQNNIRNTPRLLKEIQAKASPTLITAMRHTANGDDETPPISKEEHLIERIVRKAKAIYLQKTIVDKFADWPKPEDAKGSMFSKRPVNRQEAILRALLKLNVEPPEIAAPEIAALREETEEEAIARKEAREAREIINTSITTMLIEGFPDLFNLTFDEYGHSELTSSNKDVYNALDLKNGYVHPDSFNQAALKTLSDENPKEPLWAVLRSMIPVETMENEEKMVARPSLMRSSSASMGLPTPPPPPITLAQKMDAYNDVVSRLDKNQLGYKGQENIGLVVVKNMTEVFNKNEASISADATSEINFDNIKKTTKKWEKKTKKNEKAPKGLSGKIKEFESTIKNTQKELERELEDLHAMSELMEEAVALSRDEEKNEEDLANITAYVAKALKLATPLAQNPNYDKDLMSVFGKDSSPAISIACDRDLDVREQFMELQVLIPDEQAEKFELFKKEGKIEAVLDYAIAISSENSNYNTEIWNKLQSRQEALDYIDSQPLLNYKYNLFLNSFYSNPDNILTESATHQKKVEVSNKIFETLKRADEYKDTNSELSAILFQNALNMAIRLASIDQNPKLHSLLELIFKPHSETISEHPDLKEKFAQFNQLVNPDLAEEEDLEDEQDLTAESANALAAAITTHLSQAGTSDSLNSMKAALDGAIRIAQFDKSMCDEYKTMFQDGQLYEGYVNKYFNEEGIKDQWATLAGLIQTDNELFEQIKNLKPEGSGRISPNSVAGDGGNPDMSARSLRHSTEVNEEKALELAVILAGRSNEFNHGLRDMFADDDDDDIPEELQDAMDAFQQQKYRKIMTEMDKVSEAIKLESAKGWFSTKNPELLNDALEQTLLPALESAIYFYPDNSDNINAVVDASTEVILLLTALNRKSTGQPYTKSIKEVQQIIDTLNGPEQSLDDDADEEAALISSKFSRRKVGDNTHH
ncbi:MAG: hypothetical protein QNK11_03155, partial [Legionella sp.]|nr:hypothetical protein [Legionella sp.]